MGVGALLALTAGSSVLSAYGSYSQGVAEKKSYDIAAQEVEEAGAIKIEEIAQEGESLRSTQAAMYAKAGVRQSGSPLEVMLDSATSVEFDKMVEQWNTEVKAQNLRYAGALAKQKGMFQAGQTLLGGAMKMIQYGGVGKVPTTTTAEGGPAGSLEMG
jgi:hypothetical protein